MLATARRLNPQLFLAARQNRPTSAALFEAMRVDALLVPTEVVAHEVYAQISTPMLWRFIQGMPAQGDEWAAELIQRLRHNCGRELPALWKVKLDREQAPALGALAGRRPGRAGATCCAARRTGAGSSGWCRCCCSAATKPSSPRTTTRCWRRTTSCCSPARARSGASWRAPWSSTRPRRTCCSTSTSRELGVAQAVREGLHPGARLTAASRSYALSGNHRSAGQMADASSRPATGGSERANVVRLLALRALGGVELHRAGPLSRDR